MGDFNAHSQTWGCRDNNRHGKLIEDFILKQNLSILNTDSSTYFHPGSGSLSAIDLSLCDPSLFLDLSWSVHDDLCGSDHFPVLVRSSQKDNRDAVPTWKLDRADWHAFSDACSRELTIENTDTGDDSIESFSEKLLAIAADSIPKSKPGKRTVNTLWFNNDCKAAVRSRRKALKRATVSPSSENIENIESSGLKAEEPSDHLADNHGNLLSPK